MIIANAHVLPTTNISGAEGSIPNGRRVPPYSSLTVHRHTPADPGHSGHNEEHTCFSPGIGRIKERSHTAGMFSSAQCTTITGGVFYSIQGNLTHISPAQSAHAEEFRQPGC